MCIFSSSVTLMHEFCSILTVLLSDVIFLMFLSLYYIFDRWVNNCVGVGNHKLFLLFVFWVFVTCMYSMVLVLVKYISCINGGYRCHSGASHQLLVIFLVVESILFGLFTLCMLGDQVSAIQSNQTQIDRLKNTKATTYQNEVNEVCGSARTERFQWQWLLPMKVLFICLNDI